MRCNLIVIPMLGRSSRFFNAGYSIPKYQLPLGDETVFSKSVRTFDSYFKKAPFLFIVRKDHDAFDFVSKEVCKLGIVDFRIMELDIETRGQAESVEIGIRDYSDEIPLLIFNIDTIRHNFELPNSEFIGDGFLEVFEGLGNGWSFVGPGEGNRVNLTTEKDRISNLCSNGLYYFGCIKFFREAYQECVASKSFLNGEIYIAPLYNTLIAKGLDIRYIEVPGREIEHCGIPEDYEKLRKKFNIDL